MEPGSLSRELAFAATFLPIFGVVATVFAVARTRGSARWAVAVVLPALTYAVVRWVAPAAMHDGNLLAALLFIAYYVALAAYYPALLMIGLIAIARARRCGLRAAD